MPLRHRMAAKNMAQIIIEVSTGAFVGYHILRRRKAIPLLLLNKALHEQAVAVATGFESLRSVLDK
jgi:hypothetical protein